MQRMKIYTASVGVKNRGSTQMVDVNKHSQNKNNVNLFIIAFKEKPSNKEGNYKM